VAARDLAPALRDAARDQVLAAGSVAFLLAVVVTGLLSWVIAGR